MCKLHMQTNFMSLYIYDQYIQIYNFVTKERHLFLHSKSFTMMHVTLYIATPEGLGIIFTEFLVD